MKIRLRSFNASKILPGIQLNGLDACNSDVPILLQMRKGNKHKAKSLSTKGKATLKMMDESFPFVVAFLQYKVRLNRYRRLAPCN